MIKKIRKRHDAAEGKFADRHHERCHHDRDWLLEVAEDQIRHIKELTRQGERLEKRIAELEHQLAGCTCPTVAQLRRQEICPKCNQEMGSPHHCRPDWSGSSIGGKVVNDEH